MSGQIEICYDDFSPHQSLDVAGEFTNWNPVPLGLDEGTRYGAIFDGAEVGASYAYKFIVDGEWRLLTDLPVAQDPLGNLNHTIVAVPISSEGEDRPVEAAGASALTEPAPEPYELKSSQIPYSTTAVTENLAGTSLDPQPEPYELTSSEVPHSVEVVGELPTEPAAASSEPPAQTKVAMPGSAPYELEDAALTPSSEPTEIVADEEPAAAPYELDESELTKPVDVVPGFSEFAEKERKKVDTYEFAEQDLDEPIDVVGTVGATDSQSVPVDTVKSVDEDYADAYHDTSDLSVPAELTPPGVSAAPPRTTVVKRDFSGSQPHHPVDVMTGFPVDSVDAEQATPPTTKKQNFHVGGSPSLRAEPPRSRAAQPPAPLSASGSQQNRQAAVAAAAAKASAFARQDVAKLPGPPEEQAAPEAKGEEVKGGKLKRFFSRFGK